MPARPRRRAVGPRGARPPQDEPRPSDEDRDAPLPSESRDDERLRAERPPHHDRGV